MGRPRDHVRLLAAERVELDRSTLSNTPARTDELSLHVGDLREQISKMLPNTAPLPVPLNPEMGEVRAERIEVS